MDVTKETVTEIVRDVSAELADRWDASIAKAQEANRKHVEAVSAQDEPQTPKGYHFPDSGENGAMARATKAARCVRYYLATKSMAGARDLANESDDKEVADALDKAMGQSTLAGGGALIPPAFADGIIEILGAKSVVRAAGPTVLPMAGSLSLPYGDTGNTAYYVGENQNVTSSDMTTGELQLRDKILAAVVAVSDSLLNNGGQRVDNFIRDEMIKVMSRRQDLAFISGDGTVGTPKGMLNWCPAGNKFNANGTPTAITVTNELANAQYLVDVGNVTIDSGAWFMHPRSKWSLMKLRDGNNNLIFASELAQGRLMGWPVYTTTQIPINLGSGTDESKVYFANMSDLVIADNEDLMVEAFPGGSYYNGSSVVSGISAMQTPFRTRSVHDFGARFRGAEIAVIEAVKWAVV